MKTISLILHRIKQYWMNHKTMLIIFLLGGIISALVYSYLYGNLVKYMISRDSTDANYRKYSIWYNDGSSFEMNQIWDIYQSELVETVELSCIIPGDELNSFVADMNDQPSIICERGSLNLGLTDNAIILPTYISGSVGDSVELFGKEFKVVGQHTYTDYYVSFEDFLEIDPPINKVVVRAINRQNFSNDEVYKLVEESFPNAEIRSPQRLDAYVQSQSNSDIVIISIAYAISLCSYMFLLRYLMDSMLNSTIISIIVGAQRKKIFTIVLLEVLILCTVVNSLGIALHHILYPFVFSHINISKDLVYSAKDYAVIFLIMQFVGLIVAIPFTKKYAKLSPVESRRYVD